jgi:hypothetical protein
MKRFESIPRERFEGVLSFLLNAAPFQTIEDLTRCNCRGIYIMVLDQYKQIYIGKAKNIKDRIKQHWYNKIHFDRLLFGTIESSILSIDSFGPLDTTRIFILPIQTDIDEVEEGFVNSINSIYLLNRINGGQSSPLIALLTRKTRSFDEFPEDTVDYCELPKRKSKKAVREKHTELVEIKCFEKQSEIGLEQVCIGKVICVQLAGKEYIGNVRNITNNYITICLYGNGNQVKLEAAKLKKIESNSYQQTKRFAKKSLQYLFETSATSFFTNKTRWKTVAYVERNLWE